MSQSGMVHALEETYRVLKPRGTLVDLRPAPAHRQIGLGAGPTWQPVETLRELLDDDYAANAAVDEVVGRGLFRRVKRKRFLLDRVLDNVDELREFIAEFAQRRDLPSQEPLVDRLERLYNRQRKPGKVAVRGPMQLGILRKTSRTGANMIVAILPNASTAEQLLNNLSEAEFDLKNVSVLMQDTAMRNKIAKDTGPLKGVAPAQASASLKAAGVSADAAQKCQEAIKNAKVVVAMKVDPKYEPAAREMFKDIAAQVL
jgi:hypothetical protein